MQNLLDDLKKLLTADERLVVEGKLMKNKIIELGLALDKGLLSLLLSNATIKKHFFEEVSGTLVFDKIKFMKFVSNKEFLPDSYTSFKNKIGLTIDDEFITENKEVVLSFPYKDGILEGGQTKDDVKRNEKFWNLTLAPDQIDRLLHPKVFSNFKKYSKDGFKNVAEVTSNDNFIFRGNNLIVLHSIAKVYSGKLKMIYIDPPYNTGSDSFLYNDSFNHSTWLVFMKNRLEIAWQLLSPDGAFFIQVDDTEHAYLKVLCDEVFGRENFKENIVLKSSTESGVNAINVKRGERLFKVKEHILFYTKSPSFRFNPFYTKADYNLNYKYKVTKAKSGYTITDLSKDFYSKNLNGKKFKDLPQSEQIALEQEFISLCLTNPENIYSLEKNIKKAGEKFKEFAAKNKEKGIVEEYLNSRNEIVLIYDGGALVPLKERIISENGSNYFGVLASDLWVDIGTTPSNEGGISFNNGKKSEKLLKRIIEMTTAENDIILDYHLGSGSTAATAHKLKRRYIGIEQLDYGENDSVVRLQNVINGDKTGISQMVNWQGGGSFIYCELFKLNQQFVDEVNAAKSTKALLEIYSNLIEAGFISYEISNLSSEQLNSSFETLSLNEQKQAMLSILDFNHLYLNYSEIDDSSFKISKQEKSLNNQFYSLKVK